MKRKPMQASRSTYTREHPSPRYLELLDMYRSMHSTGERNLGLPPERTFDGMSLRPHLKTIKHLVDHYRASDILDYGSGKGALHHPRTTIKLPDGRQFSGVDGFWGVRTACYDPAYPPLSNPPTKQFDGVICTDVLEHCPEEDLYWIIGELFSHAKRFVFANIACYPAIKSLPNGENAHTTIRPACWWDEIIADTASRYPGVCYHFLFKTIFTSLRDPNTAHRKLELIEGPPHCRKVAA